MEPKKNPDMGVDALEKLAYLIAEEFIGESKRRLTRELLEGNRAKDVDHDLITACNTWPSGEDSPRVKKAGGGS